MKALRSRRTCPRRPGDSSGRLCACGRSRPAASSSGASSTSASSTVKRTSSSAGASFVGASYEDCSSSIKRTSLCVSGSSSARTVAPHTKRDKSVAKEHTGPSIEISAASSQYPTLAWLLPGRVMLRVSHLRGSTHADSPGADRTDRNCSWKGRRTSTSRTPRAAWKERLLLPRPR